MEAAAVADAPRSPVPLEPGSPLAVIAFAPGSTALAAEAEPALRRAAAEAAGGAGSGARLLRVVGHGAETALAVDRARAVGLRLMRLGVPADRLRLSAGPEGGAAADEARLFLGAGEGR